MKWFNLVLIVLLLILQFKLWIGEGSVSRLIAINHKIEVQTAENQVASTRNRLIAAQVFSLQKGNEAIEAYARSQLGLIKSDETFYMLVNPSD